MLNTWTAIFPDAERYFVRWSKKALASVTDPKIKKDIQGFIGQETMHAMQHEKLWSVLKAQGYNLDPVVWVVGKVAPLYSIAKMRPSLSMATKSG